MNLFSYTFLPRPYRSTFRLTHERKFSCQMGRLIPNFCEEVVPSDKWSVLTTHSVELAPLIAPLLDNIDLYQYYFFVPRRLLSSAWDTWIFQGEPTDNANIPFPPRFRLTAYDSSKGEIPLTAAQLKQYAGVGSLLDYLGFSTNPAQLGNTIPVDQALDYDVAPILAYNAVWLNYFRNENLTPLPTTWGNPDGFSSVYDKTTQINLSDWKSHNFYYRNNVVAPITTYLSSGDEDNTSRSDILLPHIRPRKANYLHDYFTSSLPFTQRGPSVTIPVGDSAPVILDKNSPNRQTIYNTSPSTTPLSGTLSGSSTSGNTGQLLAGNSGAALDPNGTLSVDLSEVTGISILDLRKLASLQRWLESMAPSGNRPFEAIRNHFGIRISDQRCDRPIFLGGGRISVSISNVLQTSQSTSNSPQANPSGYAKGMGVSGFKNKYFEEHGFIIGICYLMPRPTYCQGTRRFFTKKSRFDYFWPAFETIGEQPVFNHEIYDDGTNTENNISEFGYLPRYADYKYIPSSIHGDFLTTLNFWHAARIFTSRPHLNSSFLHLGSDINRIFAVQDSASTQNCWFWIRHNVKVRRPMRKNPTPSLR